MTTKRPPSLFPMFNRMIVVIICGVILIGPISGFVEAVRRHDFLLATLAVGFMVFCLAMIVMAIRFRRPSQEEFEEGIAAPLAFPDRDPIELHEPNWLASRFLIQKLRPAPLEFGTVAVDMDANRICFQNCFCPRTRGFLATKSVIGYHTVDLSEVLHVEEIRNFDFSGRTLYIFTDGGRIFLPDHATNYKSLFNLLARLTENSAEIELIRKPWIERLLYASAVVCIACTIVWISFLMI